MASSITSAPPTPPSSMCKRMARTLHSPTGSAFAAGIPLSTMAGPASANSPPSKSEHGLASESLREHIFAINKRWMDPDGDGDPSDGVDGWRLDVPEEVPMAFWVEWCAYVRSINPDAYIVGEIWKAGMARWANLRRPHELPLRRDRWSGLAIGNTNLGLRGGSAIRRTPPLRSHRAAESGRQPRYRSTGLQIAQPRSRTTAETENKTKRTTARSPDPSTSKHNWWPLQMTSPGAPMIYYGDEGAFGDPTIPTTANQCFGKTSSPTKSLAWR